MKKGMVRLRLLLWMQVKMTAFLYSLKLRISLRRTNTWIVTGMRRVLILRD